MNTSQSTHFYVYYRLRPDTDADIAHASVRAMQAAVARQTGIQGRLLQREGEPDTWMEIYEGVADSLKFAQTLEAETAAHCLGDLLDAGGVRHIERFIETL
ncbi:MAG TPA: DUF4936 family protein [Thauera sp.]|jgi:hypothetical protein|nr:DUF4936 family protein [Thauera sp.]HRA80870.1 DUF4936 family protein [Thauera sp.]